MNEVLFKMVNQNIEKFVNSMFVDYMMCTTTFNLWMSRGGNNTFALVVSFIIFLWVPFHVMINMFNVESTISNAMVE